MKKIILFFITALVFISITGCGKKAAQTFQEQETKAAHETISTMEEPIDALMRNMLENGTAYDAANPTFFWNSLYYFLGNDEEKNSLVTKNEDGTLKVPKKVAQEYAIALFASYDDLLPLPETLADYIVYDKDWDAYIITPGDYSGMKTEISDFKKTEYGYTLHAKLISTKNEGEILGECLVTMQKNAFADGIVDPRYFYSVADMAIINGFPPKPQTMSAVFSGLSDGHTVEATLPDGTVGAFQFYEPAVANALTPMKEGDAFTFDYITEKASGALTITAIH